MSVLPTIHLREPWRVQLTRCTGWVFKSIRTCPGARQSSNQVLCRLHGVLSSSAVVFNKQRWFPLCCLPAEYRRPLLLLVARHSPLDPPPQRPSLFAASEDPRPRWVCPHSPTSKDLRLWANLPIATYNEYYMLTPSYETAAKENEINCIGDMP